MKHYIGLDVSMKRTFICVINEQGKIIHEGSQNTDPHLIADYLSELGKEKRVDNPCAQLENLLLIYDPCHLNRKEAKIILKIDEPLITQEI